MAVRAIWGLGWALLVKRCFGWRPTSPRTQQKARWLPVPGKPGLPINSVVQYLPKQGEESSALRAKLQRLLTQTLQSHAPGRLSCLLEPSLAAFLMHLLNRFQQSPAVPSSANRSLQALVCFRLGWSLLLQDRLMEGWRQSPGKRLH